MSTGTIVFVHGTGVRLSKFQRTLEHARRVASQAGISEAFVECAWGDPLGVQFEGRSLPDPPSRAKLAEEAEDFARWNWLFDDPLFELDKLTIRDPDASKPIPMPGSKPAWLILWEKIAAYQPTPELELLLARGDLNDAWADAWSTVTHSPITRMAFEASAHELAEASHALARAVIAQLYVDAEASDIPGPNRALRQSLFNRLIADWDQQVYGLGAFFASMLKRAVTQVLRHHRESFSDSAVLPIGDILLYQSRGEQVRQFIRDKIDAATPPVTLIAHSLGGIACVDLLLLPDPPVVERLVTVGSQSPFFYEIGALYSLKPPAPLPSDFPPWLNLYDRNDFLSYVAGRLWPAVKDVEVESGNPFPESHGAYFADEAVWRTIRDFMQS